ncbi:MAG: hypothetical protein HY755_05025 [Nitrospirae bacterium]|nr:hypothetical protein [Nitrospirota bacterium]
MKARKEMAKKGLYLGTGAGIILFVLVGLFSGSVIGGIIGLKIANGIFGGPVSAAILPRIIVAVSMIMGIIVSAMVFVLGTGIAGWTLGFIADAIRSGRYVEVMEKAQ